MSEIMHYYEKIAAEKAKVQLAITWSKRNLARGIPQHDLVNDIAEDLGMSKEEAMAFFNENVVNAE